MRNEVVISLAIVLMVVGAGAGYFEGNSGRQTITTTATLVSSATKTSTSTYTATSTVLSTVTETQSVLAGTGCSTPVKQPPAGTNDTNLFYLSEPSEAAICVTYEYEGQGNVSFARDFVYNYGGSGSSCNVTPCPGISWSVSPTYATFNGITNVTVTYRFTTSAGLQKGLYWLMVTSCSAIVLVYVENFTRINIGGTGPLDCFGSQPPAPIGIWAVGVSNMTVSAVPVWA
jgi:hypothetical protein